MEQPIRTPADSTRATEIVAQGGLKAIQQQREHLVGHGIDAEVVRPPGADPNA